MSKGDRPRPCDIPRAEYERRWEAVFGKKKPDTPAKPPGPPPGAK